LISFAAFPANAINLAELDCTGMVQRAVVDEHASCVQVVIAVISVLLVVESIMDSLGTGRRADPASWLRRYTLR
jgi:hypothetical protein